MNTISKTKIEIIGCSFKMPKDGICNEFPVNHKGICAGHNKYLEQTKGKKQIRIAALWHEACGVARTKVIFKIGGRNSEGKEYAYWMNREVYNSIPLGVEATPEDYRKFGKVDRALNTDIYSLQ